MELHDPSRQREPESGPLVLPRLVGALELKGFTNPVPALNVLGLKAEPPGLPT